MPHEFVADPHQIVVSGLSRGDQLRITFAVFASQSGRLVPGRGELGGEQIGECRVHRLLGGIIRCTARGQSRLNRLLILRGFGFQPCQGDLICDPVADRQLGQYRRVDTDLTSVTDDKLRVLDGGELGKQRILRRLDGRCTGMGGGCPVLQRFSHAPRITMDLVVPIAHRVTTGTNPVVVRTVHGPGRGIHRVTECRGLLFPLRGLGVQNLRIPLAHLRDRGSAHQASCSVVAVNLTADSSSVPS